LKIDDYISKVIGTIKCLEEQWFTGKLTLKLEFSQGGIRDAKEITEKKIK